MKLTKWNLTFKKQPKENVSDTEQREKTIIEADLTFEVDLFQQHITREVNDAIIAEIVKGLKDDINVRIQSLKAEIISGNIKNY